MKINVPKYLRERFSHIELCYGLIDDCKYLLYFAEGWHWYGATNVPIKNLKEVKHFLIECERSKINE